MLTKRRILQCYILAFSLSELQLFMRIMSGSIAIIAIFVFYSDFIVSLLVTIDLLMIISYVGREFYGCWLNGTYHRDMGP